MKNASSSEVSRRVMNESSRARAIYLHLQVLGGSSIGDRYWRVEWVGLFTLWPLKWSTAGKKKKTSSACNCGITVYLVIIIRRNYHYLTANKQNRLITITLIIIIFSHFAWLLLTLLVHSHYHLQTTCTPMLRSCPVQLVMVEPVQLTLLDEWRTCSLAAVLSTRRGPCHWMHSTLNLVSYTIGSRAGSVPDRS